jgi:hypothetical protein
VTYELGIRLGAVELLAVRTLGARQRPDAALDVGLGDDEGRIGVRGRRPRAQRDAAPGEHE